MQNSPQVQALTTDTILVMNTASTFEINEYEVFTLAFEAWYGRAAEFKEIESEYVRYMTKGIIPAWVRSYCRSYVSMETVQAFSLYSSADDATGKFLRQLIICACLVVSMLVVASTINI